MQMSSLRAHISTPTTPRVPCEVKSSVKSSQVYMTTVYVYRGDDRADTSDGLAHPDSLTRSPQDGGRACCLRRGLLFGAAYL